LATDRYSQLGASATKAGLHSQLDKLGLSSGEGLFAGVTPDFAGDDSYWSFLHSDGAGTKSIVALLSYLENGDINSFTGLAQDALVMNLDDVFCLGIPENLVLANAIARNSRIINDQMVGAVIGGYKALTDRLSKLGINIQLGGGETADCGDVVRNLLVDAVIAGRIKKSAVINPNLIVPGDVIVGLASFGKASYEDSQNSGIGSNGLTLARHALLSKKHLPSSLDVADPGADNSVCYTGPFKVSDSPENLGMSIGQALLSPTRSFAPVLKKIYQTLGNQVHGAIHVTGGGLTKVLRFGKGNRYVKDSLFPVPPIFQLIQQHGEVSWKEMHQVFNMGQRFELYLPEKYTEVAISAAAEFSIDAKIIGHVEALDDNSKHNEVVVKSTNGQFEYNL